MSGRTKKPARKGGGGGKAGWLGFGKARARRRKSKEAARAPVRPTVWPRPWPARSGLVLLALLIAVVGSGLLAVWRADEVRQLHRSLEAARQRQDELAAEHSRLLLQRSALSAYYNVERVAARDLGMRFPDQVRRLPR